jgi:hypothetical protein
MQRGDRVRIIAWAENNVGPSAAHDRRTLIGHTGTILDAGLYISVLLDDDPAHVKAAVIAIESELEVINDADANQAEDVA